MSFISHSSTNAYSKKRDTLISVGYHYFVYFVYYYV